MSDSPASRPTLTPWQLFTFYTKATLQGFKQQLRKGVSVKIENSVVPTTDPAPTPADK